MIRHILLLTACALLFLAPTCSAVQAPTPQELPGHPGPTGNPGEKPPKDALPQPAPMDQNRAWLVHAIIAPYCAPDTTCAKKVFLCYYKVDPTLSAKTIPDLLDCIDEVVVTP